MSNNNELLPLKIVGSAFHYVWTERVTFLRMATLPVVVLSILSAVIWVVYPPEAAPEGFETLPQEEQLAVMLGVLLNPGRILELLVELVLYVMFAAAWHRAFLVPDEEITIARALSWNSNKTYFLFSLIVVFLLAGVAGVLAGSLILQVFQAVLGQFSVGIMFGTTMAFWFYVFGRLSPIFPTTAIGQRIGLRGAWRFSSGSGWRLAMISLFPYIPVMVVLFVAATMMGTVLSAMGLGDGATGTLVLELTVQIIAYYGLAVAVSALSMAYLELEDEAPV